MANSTVPKHDFVPAWLKISGDTSTAAEISENRERRSRRDNRNATKGPSIGRSRQSSCDQQYSHRDGQDSAISYRHHSIDIDESQYYAYRLGDCHIANYRHFGSQPSLSRRSVSRQESNSFVNSSGTYKGYSLYDFSPESSPATNNLGNQCKHNFDRSCNNAQTNKKDTTDMKNESKTIDRFNQEFPSLKGDCGDVSSTPSVSVNGGVWDNIRNARFITCNAKKVSGSEKNEPEKRSGSPGLLSTNCSVSPVGKVGKPNSPSVVQISKPSLQCQPLTYPPLTTLVRKTSKEPYKNNSSNATKNSCHSSSTPPPLEILNTRLVTHPKNVGNKNDFLKTLRSEIEKSCCELQECKKGTEMEEIHSENGKEYGFQNQKNGSENDVKPSERNGDGPLQKDITLNQCTETFETNGINFRCTVEESREKPLLSSSLEAEQRLLREMGWKEDDSGDEDVYAPLTEDEMREFQNLSKKVIQQKNGMVRNTQLSWSPKRLLAPPFSNASLIPPLDDDSCSTSFSDSD